jgi:hypothetical protein
MRNKKKRSGLAHWCLSLLVIMPGIAAADIVTDWSLVTTQAILAKGGRAGAVEFAIVQAAVFDAVNSIERRYYPYKIVPTSPRLGASAEAAAAAAAHRTLLGLFPEQAAMLDAAYATSLATLPDDAARAKGVVLGDEVGLAMVALRANDGRAAVIPAYVFGSGAGVYQQTIPYPPTGQPVNTHLAGVTPMVLASASQFRAYGPPGLTSVRYKKDLEEVRQYGGLTSTLRTDAQTENARFHTENPNLFWGRNLSNFVASRDLGTLRSARLMALLTFAEADGGIACFDSKFTYNFWRPSTAIQQDDPSWLPSVNTPPHPEYPAAHGCVDGAVVGIMDEFFGRQRLTFSFNSTVTGTIHDYRCTQDLVDEITNARVHGGMHFRNSVKHGLEVGRGVANWINSHALLPRHRDRY